jgi:glucose/arabinose dehydrogenase
VDSLDDPTPSIYADLRTQTDDYADRGLLGLALDPDWASRPYVYVAYTYDKDPNSPQVPRWHDGCPTPPGLDADGCTVLGRISRIDPAGDEHVLVEDYCQQFTSHSIGTVEFGPDGALYAGGGDGANSNLVDSGRLGGNPCHDPPSEGGALRSQDLRTPGDPTGLNGAIIRIDPDTGAALPTNPGSGDANARRIVAYGFRNPFRFTFRPGTGELWVGDVGWDRWEEINRIVNPAAGVLNHGWPCREGPDRSGYDSAGLPICQALPASAVTAPYYVYDHLEPSVATGDDCPNLRSSVSGLAFPDFQAYRGALFFADHSRQCIWAMLPTAGVPDPKNVVPFASQAGGPVDLQLGPRGELYYVDLSDGSIRRIRERSSGPTAVATATPPPDRCR